MSETLQVRRQYEDRGIEIVAAIRRDYLPGMDDNDGGQILVWILDLVQEAYQAALDAQAQERDTAYRVRDDAQAASNRDLEARREAAHRAEVAEARAEALGEALKDIVIHCEAAMDAAASPGAVMIASMIRGVARRALLARPEADRKEQG